ncbi:5,10-methylenetetrahydrofolate reductase [hydrothermal vent metagenome]|uniref:methylenetetrahydrofolate reductase (NADH) n=1 Tax=hydrothermal vent metagenome TaxID=652676 RepID=A0A3B0S6S2_9ZZZZ
MTHSPPPSTSAQPIEVSFEFFPPKTPKMEAKLWQSVEKLAPLQPTFMSVTYGAGGTTRERTRETVLQMAKKTGISVAAHLTCVETSKAQVDATIQSYRDAGIRHIVALRGDPASGISGIYQPDENGYAYASDLVRAIKCSGEMAVSVAAYPERHPASANWQSELDNLQRKIDAGADQAITQFGFEANTLIEFRERLHKAGISIPIVPGIMLQPNFTGLVRMAKMCGTCIPKRMFELFEGTEDDLVSRQLLTANLVAEYCIKLQEAGFHRFHFYTLNSADFAYTTCRVLGLKPQSEPNK